MARIERDPGSLPFWGGVVFGNSGATVIVIVFVLTSKSWKNLHKEHIANPSQRYRLCKTRIVALFVSFLSK